MSVKFSNGWWWWWWWWCNSAETSRIGEKEFWFGSQDVHELSWNLRFEHCDLIHNEERVLI
jgi:hypothetical protein